MKVRLRGVRRVPISGEFIRLDSLLKFASVASTGGEAKLIIQSGSALVGGEPCLQRGRKVRHGDIVQCEGCVLMITEAVQA
jgi:ribosome-associated protein